MLPAIVYASIFRNLRKWQDEMKDLNSTYLAVMALLACVLACFLFYAIAESGFMYRMTMLMIIIGSMIGASLLYTLVCLNQLLHLV